LKAPARDGLTACGVEASHTLKASAFVTLNIKQDNKWSDAVTSMKKGSKPPGIDSFAISKHMSFKANSLKR